MGIPHVTIEHGAPFFYQGGKQYYRKNIGAANIKLLWGNYNLDMMKKYGCSKKILRVTGFPRFDDLIKFSSPDYYYGTIYCLAIVIFTLAVYFFRMNRKKDHISDKANS